MLMYKSQDKTIMNNFKLYLKENVKEEAEYTYNFFKKQRNIDDLNTYLRLKTNDIIETGFGNTNSNVIIILHEKNIEVLNYLKKMFINFNNSPELQRTFKKTTDYNNIYFTYFKKGTKENNELYKEILTKEIEVINPKIIISIGNFIERDNVVLVDEVIFDKLMKLSNKKDLTIEETKELATYKISIWKQMQKIFVYY